MVVLVATIHVLAGRGEAKDVGARDKPEHDGSGNRDASSLLPLREKVARRVG